MGTGSSPRGKKRPGRDADPSPPCSAVGHERVELYLYSPSGPYGLYRASVPVQGCTLPLLLWSMERSEILAFRRDVDDNCALLGYYAASSDYFVLTFRDNLSVPCSGFKFFNPEHGTTQFAA